MRQVLTIAMKDLRLLWRDKFGLFWILVFPLIFALFFGILFAGQADERGSGPLPVALVDEDRTEGSRLFTEELRASGALELRDLPREVAEDEVRRGKRVAYLLLRPGFGDGAGLPSNGPPEITLGIDPSRRAEAGYLQGLLMKAAVALLQKRSFASEIPGDFPHLQPIKLMASDVTALRNGPRTAFEVSFPSAILWGVMGCAAGFAISLVVERAGGTYFRLRLAPLRRGQILAGKGVACFTACLTVMTLLLVVGWSLFGVRIVRPGALGVAMVSTSLCFVGLMMFLSSIGRTEQSVAGAGWAMISIMAMFGGGMVPLIAMPSWMQNVSNLSPVKWGIVALEGAIWRDFTWPEMLLPCAVLLGVGGAFFLGGVLLLDRLHDGPSAGIRSSIAT